MTNELSLLTCGVCYKKTRLVHTLDICAANLNMTLAVIRVEIEASRKIAQACGLMKGYYIPPERAARIDEALS